MIALFLPLGFARRAACFIAALWLLLSVLPSFGFAENKCLYLPKAERGAEYDALRHRALCKDALNAWLESPTPRDRMQRLEHDMLRTDMLYFYALTYVYRSEIEEALKLLENLAQDPSWAGLKPSPARIDHDLLLLLTDRWREAGPRLNEPLNTKSATMVLDAWWRTSYSLNLGDMDGAAATISQGLNATASSPDQSLWPEYLGHAQAALDIALGNYSAALSRLEPLAMLETRRLSAARWIAVTQREMGNEDAAIKTSLRAVEIAERASHPLNTVFARMTLALTLLKTSNDPPAVALEALEAADAAIATAEGIAISGFLKAAMEDLRGRALQAMGDHEAALESFLKSTELEPYLRYHYAQGIHLDLDNMSGIHPEVSPEAVERLLTRCLEAGCTVPEPRRCAYDGPGIACVPVIW